MMQAAVGTRPRSSRSQEAAVVVSIFLASLAYFNLTAHLTLDLRDEGYLLHTIARVASGEMPHRDFAELYGPGVYAITAPVFSLFGEQVLPLRQLLVVFRAAAVALSYLIARHLVPRRFAMIAAFVSAAYWGRVLWNLNTPYAALFTVPLCMLSLLLLLRGLSRPRGSVFLASGIACGAALTFKWSLAAVSAYGMILALCSSTLLHERSSGGRGLRAPALVALLAAGLALVVPFGSMMSPLDYLLHFAPIHVLMALVGLRFARFGGTRSLLATAGPRVAWYCAGLVVVPAAVCAIYLSWGALGDLVHNLVRPRSFRNYYLPVEVSLSRAVLLPLALVPVSAALAWLRGSWRALAILAGAAALLVPAGFWSVAVEGSPWISLQRSTLLLPCLLASATLVPVGRALWRPHPLELEPTLGAIVAVLFFQEMMAFQIFPRGQFNVSLMAGTLGPLVAYLLYRWYGAWFGSEDAVTPWRRAVAFGLMTSFPLLFVGSVVRGTILAPGLADTTFAAPALSGVRVPSEGREDFGEFDELVTWLADAEPVDAPVFLLSNESMIYFASGREPLFPEYSLMLFLLGWNLLPPEDPDLPPESLLIERLIERPETFVILRPRDGSTANFVKQFPSVGRLINSSYRDVASVGGYRVLQRARAKL
jgi:hypothetical protein